MNKFMTGDMVEYTNPQGVQLGKKEIVGIDMESNGSYRYFIAPTDTPWFPVREEGINPCTPTK